MRADFRTLAKQSPVKPTYTLWSLKNDRAFYIESLLELQFAHLLEFLPAVSQYQTQPDPLHFEFLGKHSRYTPDFSLNTATGLTLVEIKPYKHATQERFALKSKVLKALYSKAGATFVVVTDREIRSGDRTKNHSILYVWRAQPAVCKKDLSSLLGASHSDGATFGQLVDREKKVQLQKGTVLRALAHGQISADLTQPLARELKIFWHSGHS